MFPTGLYVRLTSWRQMKIGPRSKLQDPAELSTCMMCDEGWTRFSRLRDGYELVTIKRNLVTLDQRARLLGGGFTLQGLPASVTRLRLQAGGGNAIPATCEWGPVSCRSALRFLPAYPLQGT